MKRVKNTSVGRLRLRPANSSDRERLQWQMQSSEKLWTPMGAYCWSRRVTIEISLILLRFN